MRARAAWWSARADLRARGGWALLLTVATMLYPATLPPGVASPGLGPMLAGVVLALVLVRGTVSHDLRTGAFLLWIQKPGRPAACYARRLGSLAVLLLGTHAVVVAGTALFSPLVPRTPGFLTVLVLTDLTVLALGFAVSAVAPPLESVISVLLLILLGGLAADALLAPETMGPWAPWLAAVRLPVLEQAALARWVDGTGVPPHPTALLRIALYPLGLTALGLLLVEFRSGGLARPPGDQAPS